jgi:threonine dehydratase
MINNGDLSNNNVASALHRISPYIHKTPLVSSENLNSMLGHRVIFKAESLQKTGAFKVRGVLNHLLILKEQGKLPDKIVAYSTGNHGIGVAYAARMMGIKARIYLPKNTAILKQQQAMYLGAEVIFTDTREEAEQRTKSDGNGEFYYLHPSDSETTIRGAGTVCLEALQQSSHNIDAIFASCGGGGLLSGCYLAKEEFDKKIKVIGAEPELADDAKRSIDHGSIFRFDNSPNTIADGLRTLGLSERTFGYIKKLDEFITISENDIKYWTTWLMQLLKLVSEPSCAISMAAAYYWLSNQNSAKTVLVILSGGNVDPAILSELLRGEYLLHEPKLK